MDVTLNQIDEALKNQPNEFNHFLTDMSSLWKLAGDTKLNFIYLKNEIPPEYSGKIDIAIVQLDKISKLAEALSYAVSAAHADVGHVTTFE